MRDRLASISNSMATSIDTERGIAIERRVSALEARLAARSRYYATLLLAAGAAIAAMVVAMLASHNADLMRPADSGVLYASAGAFLVALCYYVVVTWQLQRDARSDAAGEAASGRSDEPSSAVE